MNRPFVPRRPWPDRPMSMPWQQPAPWAAHRPGVSWRLMLGVALSIAAAIAGVAFALYETFAPR